MHRAFWALLALASLAATSGCAMCESYWDYAYPAYGGCCGWHADDCCRAGSAFCHDVGAPHAEETSPHTAEPVPEPAVPYDPGANDPSPLGPDPSRHDISPPAELNPPLPF